MSRLVLHSDQIDGRTEVDEALVNLIEPQSSKIGYIPSQTDSHRKYFHKAQKWYSQFGFNDLLYFDVDREFDAAKISELMGCDAIHLSGGNTYYFLNSLRGKGLLPLLRRFLENGGILIGVSAGSLIMSKTIAITQIDDDLGGDKNDVGLIDLSALGVVNFEFFPHVNKINEEIESRLMEYSRKTGSVIYACDDGDGIVVENDKIDFIGNVKKIENGVIGKVF
jgi:dipeptidase E